MTLFEAGFTPDTCPMLRTRLAYHARAVVKSFEVHHKVIVPMSCQAFDVPGELYAVSVTSLWSPRCGRDSFQGHSPSMQAADRCTEGACSVQGGTQAPLRCHRSVYQEPHARGRIPGSAPSKSMWGRSVLMTATL
ncbi:hypothetical protein BC628DRAFT_195752 [Trametes gibbosa]|nr:hypothetical protein BC628DRAFT_195752 [Trametes gibbosa]